MNQFKAVAQFFCWLFKPRKRQPEHFAPGLSPEFAKMWSDAWKIKAADVRPFFTNPPDSNYAVVFNEPSMPRPMTPEESARLDALPSVWPLTNAFAVASGSG